MGVDIRVRRFAQSDAERTLMHTIDKGNRAPLANALSNYYKKLKADERSITRKTLKNSSASHSASASDKQAAN